MMRTGHFLFRPACQPIPAPVQAQAASSVRPTPPSTENPRPGRVAPLLDLIDQMPDPSLQVVRDPLEIPFLGRAGGAGHVVRAGLVHRTRFVGDIDAVDIAAPVLANDDVALGPTGFAVHDAGEYLLGVG